MSGEIFCSSSVTPCRLTRTDHEAKFSAFLNAISSDFIQSSESTLGSSGAKLIDKPFAVQIVRQVNFGRPEWKRCLVPNQGQGESEGFAEVTERELIDANFKTVESNFKYVAYDELFELNLYKTDPANKHHGA
ncbi:hypothetical protein FRB96_009360 [Tulasnella sp. 330]|nr:hypothetical protein FRB96_009360 [Tulasnella sp. 330]